MRIVSISCVKNECDVIEACVRHAAALVDQQVILDNGSTDGTLELLRRLERSGIPMEIVEDPAPGHYHYARATRLMRDFAVAKYAADWIVPLDADEFVSVPEAGAFRELLARQPGPVNLRWRTYVPGPGDDPDERNPVIRVRHRLAEEAKSWFKVIVPGELAGRPGTSLAQGNHTVHLDGRRLEAALLEDAVLAHFPVRSPGQYAAKVAIMYLQTRATAGRGETWQFHYDRPYRLLKEDPAEFAARYREFALHFAVPPGIAFEPSVTLDPLAYHGGPLSCTPERDDQAVLLDNLLTYAETLAQRSAEVDQGRD